MVDYDSSTRVILRKMLIKDSWKVDEAENGEVALEKIKIKKPELILLDLLMPVMDGFEATLAIREFEQKNETYTPIIALTANTSPEDREKARASGMDDFLAKPITTEAINLVLKHWTKGENIDSSKTVSKTASSLRPDIRRSQKLIDLFWGRR